MFARNLFRNLCKSFPSSTETKLKHPSFDLYRVESEPHLGFWFRVTYVEKGVIRVSHYPQHPSSVKFSETRFDLTRRHGFQLDIVGISTLLVVAERRIPKVFIQESSGHEIKYEIENTHAARKSVPRKVKSTKSKGRFVLSVTHRLLPELLQQPPLTSSVYKKKTTHERTAAVKINNPPSPGLSGSQKGLNPKDVTTSSSVLALELTPSAFNITFSPHEVILWHSFLDSVLKEHLGFMEDVASHGLSVA